MPQFLIDKRSISNNIAIIADDDAHHITSVLRLKAGDWIVLTDGEGRRWRSTLKEVGRKEILAELTSLLPVPKNNARITLAQSVIKHDRMEWIVQKAVELGCTNIIPVTTERTIPRLKTDTSEKKISRWQKIAVEAMKQCGAAFTPTVTKLKSFKELVDDTTAGRSKAIMFFEGEERTPLKDILNKDASDVTIIIGPEGGFSKEEVDLARSKGVHTAGLGPLILRVETAAIAAITLVQEMTGYFERMPV